MTDITAGAIPIQRTVRRRSPFRRKLFPYLLVLPAVVRLLTSEAWLVALVKPQFEAGADRVGRGGVVRDPQVHADVIRSVVAAAAGLGLGVRGLTRSPITGPAGNVEFLLWLVHGGPTVMLESVIAHVVRPANDAARE